MVSMTEPAYVITDNGGLSTNQFSEPAKTGGRSQLKFVHSPKFLLRLP